MLCDSNDRLCLPMAPVGSLVMDMAGGVVVDMAVGVVTGALSLSDDP